MRRWLWLVALVACDGAREPKLPSTSIVPRLERRPPEAACATDIAFDDSGTPAMTYRYGYDAVGRLAFASGTYDSIHYEWDHLDHMVGLVQAAYEGTSRVEIAARYNTLGDLLEYTWTQAAPHYRSDRRYTYAAFSPTGQPTRATYAENGDEFAYQLAYDAADRLVITTGAGQTTVYTYDDDARTTTIDTNDGAFIGTIIYDERNHEVSETWGGSDPAAIASEDRYEWDGDRLLVYTRRSGTAQAPLELHTVEVDTYRYDCPY